MYYFNCLGLDIHYPAPLSLALVQALGPDPVSSHRDPSIMSSWQERPDRGYTQPYHQLQQRGEESHCPKNSSSTEVIDERRE